MKLSAAVSLALFSCTASGFHQSMVANSFRSSVSVNGHVGDVACENACRRSFMKNAVVAIAGLSIQGVAPQTAVAGLLDEYGSDPSRIKDPTADAARKNKEAITAAPKAESNYEPNLRSNYYYPTNKKRYLPRIKKCNDAIPSAAALIGSEDWEGAEEFAVKIADDTILPMKLYTSSLLGGGTNVKVAFAKDMTKAANDFEKSQKALVKAISKKDREKSSKALEELSTALLAYRTAGKLLGPDGGGDIPSVDEIRRSACRVQGRTFEQKIKQRDARLAEETSK